MNHKHYAMSSNALFVVLSSHEEEEILGGIDEADPEEERIFLSWLDSLFQSASGVSLTGVKASDYAGDGGGIRLDGLPDDTQLFAHQVVNVVEQRFWSPGFGHDDP
jgi:hypothetical protein